MSALSFAIVALTILLAVIVGAYLVLAIRGEDATVLGSAGAAAGAFLAGLVTAEVVRGRRDRP